MLKLNEKKEPKEALYKYAYKSKSLLKFRILDSTIFA